MGTEGELSMNEGGAEAVEAGTRGAVVISNGYCMTNYALAHLLHSPSMHNWPYNNLLVECAL